MDIANYINNNGELKQISADELMCIYLEGKLFCPYCDVPVVWVSGFVQSPHFRHQNRTYSDDCDLYCSKLKNSQYNNILTDNQSALYLYREFDQFFLAIGLCGVSENTLIEAQSKNLTVSIDRGIDTREIEICEQNFAPNQVFFITINEVKKNYQVKWESPVIPKEIKIKWKDPINGLFNDQGVFDFNTCAGKKVSTDVGIFQDEKYFLLTRKNICKNSYRGAEFEKITELCFAKYEKLNLYQFTVYQITEEIEKFFFEMDLHINKAKPNVVTIWPPCSRKENHLLYQSESSKYFLIKNDPELGENLFFINNDGVLKQKFEYQTIEYNALLSRFDGCEKGTLLFKNKNTQSHYDLGFDKFEIKKNCETSEIKEDENIVYIESKSKIFINYFLDELLMESKLLKANNKLQIPLTAKKFDRCEILHGLEVLKFYKMSKREVVRGVVKNEDANELLKILRAPKGQWRVKPTGYKWLVLKYKTNKSVYFELSKYLNHSKIPLELYNLLKLSK